MACGVWAIMTDARIGQLQRSYERNLGYAKFWIGVSVAFLAAFAAFAVEKIWEIAIKPEVYTPQVQTALLVGTWILIIAAFVCLILATMFILAYHRADLALAAIEQGDDDAA